MAHWQGEKRRGRAKRGVDMGREMNKSKSAEQRESSPCTGNDEEMKTSINRCRQSY